MVVLQHLRQSAVQRESALRRLRMSKTKSYYFRPMFSIIVLMETLYVLGFVTNRGERRSERKPLVKSLIPSHLSDSQLNFRDRAFTNVPSGFRRFSRQIRLRPAAIAPGAPHLLAADVPVLHTANKDSEIAPTCRADAATSPANGGFWPCSKCDPPSLLTSGNGSILSCTLKAKWTEGQRPASIPAWGNAPAAC